MTPYSEMIFTSIEAKPKIAFVGWPLEVAIDSGRREEGAVDEAVPVDQEQLAGRLGGHALNPIGGDPARIIGLRGRSHPHSSR